MAITDTVRCPSGITGVIQRLSLEDQIALSDPRIAKAGTTYINILNSCWVETLDPGPYEFHGARPDWKRLFACDEYYPVLRIARLTTGDPIYSFPFRCRWCTGRSVAHLNLDEEVEVYDLDQATIDGLKAGNRFEIPLDEHRVIVQLLRIQDQQELVKMAFGREGGDIEAVKLKWVKRVIDVPTLKPEIESEWERKTLVRQWVLGLDSGTANRLNEAYDEIEGGVDTTVYKPCHMCKTENEIEIPFDLAQLFGRRSVQRKTSDRKRARRRRR